MSKRPPRRQSIHERRAGRFSTGGTGGRRDGRNPLDSGNEGENKQHTAGKLDSSRACLTPPMSGLAGLGRAVQGRTGAVRADRSGGHFSNFALLLRCCEFARRAFAPVRWDRREKPTWPSPVPANGSAMHGRSRVRRTSSQAWLAPRCGAWLAHGAGMKKGGRGLEAVKFRGRLG